MRWMMVTLWAVGGTVPEWANLRYPYPGCTKDGEDGLPEYVCKNQAELCPSQIKFTCTPCSSQCDKPDSPSKSDQRPCELKLACHLYPTSNLPPNSTRIIQGSVSLKEISRRSILERALGWVVNNFEYKWFHSPFPLAERPVFNLEACDAASSNSSCPAQRYLSDCSGFLSMAWDLGIPTVTPNFFSNCDMSDFPSSCRGRAGVSKRINCTDLQPGDAVAVGKDHVALFRSWANQQNMQWNLLQMGGGAGKANAADGQFKAKKNACFVRVNLL